MCSFHSPFFSFSFISSFFLFSLFPIAFSCIPFHSFPLIHLPPFFLFYLPFALPLPLSSSRHHSLFLCYSFILNSIRCYILLTSILFPLPSFALPPLPFSTLPPFSSSASPSVFFFSTFLSRPAQAERVLGHTERSNKEKCWLLFACYINEHKKKQKKTKNKKLNLQKVTTRGKDFRETGRVEKRRKKERR